ncbi:unnamed protein product [Haemonchus placei]|uniref:Uncharacterized protein n=1 Tax=Haemonchus placei TaxID=6290 RepID=A0A3P7Y8I6_HAEPC|nr:unnamed protein product [Haemonchus placei]
MREFFFLFGFCYKPSANNFHFRPACIAGVGFVAGAFFALCFQCR